MEIALIVSLLACTVSIYNVFPEQSKLTFKYRISWIHKSILTILGLIVILGTILLSYFFEVYRTIDFIGARLEIELFGLTFNEAFLTKLVSLLSVVAYSAVFFLAMRSKRIHDIKGFFKFLEKQNLSGKYSKSIDLLSEFWENIKVNIVDIKKQPTKNTFSTFTKYKGAMPFKVKIKNAINNKVNQGLIFRCELVNANVSKITRNPNIIKLISSDVPEFGATILKSKLNVESRVFFSERFIEAQMTNKDSQLRFEFMNFDNSTSQPIGYRVEPVFYLINTITQVNLAFDLGISRTMGELAIKYIQSHEFATDVAKSTTVYDEREFKGGIVYAAIRYFDIVVLEALKSKFEWHMRLFYLVDFVREISNQKKPSPVDRLSLDEWIIKIIFIKYREWINEISKDDFEYETTLNYTNADNENENILKSVVIAMSRSLEIVAAYQYYQRQLAIECAKEFINSYICLAEDPSNSFTEYLAVYNCCINEIREEDKKYNIKKLLCDAFEVYDFIPLLERPNERLIRLNIEKMIKPEPHRH